MAIKVQCGHCATSFNAKDELAGKRVKCPKCTQTIVIPAARSNPAAAVAGVRQPAYNPLLDMLDEAGVEGIPEGPICDQCGAEMDPTAVVCVECGYNIMTGATIETEVYEDDDDVDHGMTDAEKIMAKAERDIDDMPVTAVGQDFGDGADSFLIAIGAMVILGILVAIGVGVIFIFDWLGDAVDSAKISFYASVGLYLLMVLWITIIAFLAKPIQGVICVATAGLYCIIFGFMQGKALIIPSIILVAAMLIGLISYFFAFGKRQEDFSFLLDDVSMISNFLTQMVSVIG